jgi:hypothetical protein
VNTILQSIGPFTFRDKTIPAFQRYVCSPELCSDPEAWTALGFSPPLWVSPVFKGSNRTVLCANGPSTCFVCELAPRGFEVCKNGVIKLAVPKILSDEDPFIGDPEGLHALSFQGVVDGQVDEFPVKVLVFGPPFATIPAGKNPDLFLPICVDGQTRFQEFTDLQLLNI